MHNPHFSYRADIDGLRALAVAAVVTFHAFPDALPGGFAGVDIFFVISGFLITHILRREIADATFSIRVFYARRIRRLFPALALVLGVTLAVGWALLLQNEFRMLGKHTRAAASFIANIVYWKEAGYFDADAELKPLLHLWSLGIEEQFYILWPLVIALAYRFKLPFWPLAGGLGLASFSANLDLMGKDPAAAFFLPHPRFWELILGGLLATAESRQRSPGGILNLTGPRSVFPQALWREITALIGLLLIAVAVTRMDKTVSFPGWWALLPTFGAVLLIGAGPQTWIARRMLAFRPLVWLGLISYPLYLWHWPLLTFARILYVDPPPTGIRALLVAVALMTAWLTYRFVEQPISKLARIETSARPVIQGLCIGLFAVFVAGLLARGGIPPERLHGLRALSEARGDMSYPGDAAASVTGMADQSILFLGDSSIMQYYPRLQWLVQAHPGKTLNVLMETSAGCPPIPGLNRKSRRECADNIGAGFVRAAADDVKTVVIGSAWSGLARQRDYYWADAPGQKTMNLNDPRQLDAALARLRHAIVLLRQQGKAVHVVLAAPTGKDTAPDALGFSRLQRNPSLPIRTAPLDAQLKARVYFNDRIRELAEQADARIIDPMDWFCKNDVCHFTDHRGIPYFTDGLHLRAAYVRCCVTVFDPLILQPAQPEAVPVARGALKMR